MNAAAGLKIVGEKWKIARGGSETLMRGNEERRN